jgi:hypothetical protein
LLQILYTPQAILSILTANAFAQRANHTNIAAIVHVASWIFQILGHKFAEGRSPALLDNPVNGSFLSCLIRKHTDPRSQRLFLPPSSFIWKYFSNLVTNQLCTSNLRTMSVWKLPSLERLKVTRNAPLKSERIETGLSMSSTEFHIVACTSYMYTRILNVPSPRLSLCAIALLQSKLSFLRCSSYGSLARFVALSFSARSTGLNPQDCPEGQALALQLALRTLRSTLRQL